MLNLSKMVIARMRWVAAFFSLVARIPQWREITTAPFDRELELAVIGQEVRVLEGSCLRHGEGWFDAATLQPIAVTATHWRYPRPDIIPTCCC